MICVKIYWNTEADGTPVPDDLDEEGPVSYYGPFQDEHHAQSWMDNDYPDGDMDVYDMEVVNIKVPRRADWINHPLSIYGDIPDEDIRD